MAQSVSNAAVVRHDGGLYPHESPTLADLRSRILSLSDALEKTVHGFEPQFLAVGENLQEILKESRELAAQTVEAAGMMSGEAENGALTGVVNLARQSMESLQGVQAQTADNARRVEQIVGYLSQFRPDAIMLRALARKLRIISVYSSVESSRFAEAERVFAAFTKQMTDLVGKIFDLQENIRASAESAEHQQTEAYRTMLESTDRLRQLVADVEQTVTRTSRDADELMNAGASAMEISGTHSREITSWVGEIVVSLQFHDITRQQVEHIVAALQDAERLCAKAACKQNIGEQDQTALFSQVYAVLKLQHAQLGQVIAVLHDAHDRIWSAFEQIGEASGDLARSVTETRGGDHDAAISDPLSELRMALLELRQLLSEGQSLNEYSRQAAEMAAEVSHQLSEHVAQVGDINEDINIQALNAIINSAKLSHRGSALAILAQEMTGLSVQCDGFVNGIVERLRAIDQLAEDLKAHSRQNSESAENDSGTALDDSIDQVMETHARYLAASASASQRTEILQSAILRAGNQVQSVLKMAELLEEHFGTMEEISALLGSNGACDDVNASELLDRFGSRYTMQSERSVHNGLIDAGRDAAKQTAKATISQRSVANDLGDNVELF